jgi:integrase
MNDLALRIVPEQLPGNLSDPEIDRAMHFARSATAASTLVAYASDYKSWVTFATARGACPMPPHAGVVAAWLSAQADAGRKASSISRAAAALAFYSKQAGIDPPVTATAGVRAVLKGIRREVGARPQGKTPIVADLLMQMLKHCPGDSLQAKRNRALLAVGFAAALRRSELCALTVDCIQFVDDGMRILIKRSKTDQTGETATIAVIRGVKIKPVALLQDWLAASGITEGPIFRPVKLGGKVGDAALRPNDTARIVKRVLGRIEGMDPSTYSGHSLRSGFLTSAAEAKSNIFKMLEVSRHRNMSTLQSYVRSAALFDDHCSANFM